jgi:hypothetical protein
VILTIAQDGGDAAELEGKVDAASEAGMAFKEKGKRDVILVMPDEIIEIALAPSKPKSLAQKKLKPVTESTVRQHLLDRHGYLRTEVNKMEDDEAFETHEAIDHADLGHKHIVESDEENESGEEGESSEED